jgi:thiamine biosynthesis lipoprotein
VVERARPLLGTRVAVRVHGLPGSAAQRAVEGAFAEIALVHRLMSFHEPDSDVSRLNRDALAGPVRVHPHTLAVLRRARELAEASSGCFDITVAARLVAWGLLPAPASSHRPDPRGTWRDVELGEAGSVRFRRALWIDLGGIAKGYAVDLAVTRLRAHGATQARVDAGGDLALLGPAVERVQLRPDADTRGLAAVLEVAGASVASSSGRLARRRQRGRGRGPHVHGTRRHAVGARSFACVVASTCVVADALTKVVLARGARSAPLLRRYGAVAHLHGSDGIWRTLAGPA